MRIRTRCRGRMQGLIDSAQGQSYTFNAEATHLEGSRVNLFSVPAACKHGHTVLFEGTPENGRHGMYVSGTREWIPFIFHPVTGLWYVRVRRNREATYGTWVGTEVPGSGPAQS